MENKDMIMIPRVKYEEMKVEIEALREAAKVDWDLVRQFKDGLDDIKAGRIKRVA